MRAKYVEKCIELTFNKIKYRLEMSERLLFPQIRNLITSMLWVGQATEFEKGIIIHNALLRICIARIAKFSDRGYLISLVHDENVHEPIFRR